MAEGKNELALVEETVKDLRDMVKESVDYQAEASPVYAEISSKILEMLNKQEELDSWQAKDLLKLLDLTNKAQLQPVEQLTKLVQSVEALYEKTELQNKMDQLSSVVEEMKNAKGSSDDSTIDADIKDLDDIVNKK